MATYVALLRGVNVAGKNKLPMADLRDLLTGLGLHDVRTYLQSGNAVFSHPAAGAGQLAGRLEKGLAEAGVPARVLLRRHDELATVLSGNPFLAREPDPAKLHVTFLLDPPAPDRTGRLQVPAGETGVLSLRDREIYLHCPDGYGRTKLNNTFIETRLGAIATTRNWRTVCALAELAELAGSADR